MIFDDLLKDLEKGANSRVLAEKLFESFQHTEIQPILKEIQYFFSIYSSACFFFLKSFFLEKKYLKKMIS